MCEKLNMYTEAVYGQSKVECQDTMCSDVEIYFKLHEAEREADSTAVRYSSKDILEALRSEITGQTEKSKK